ncbi:threonine synthase [Halapricum desulfuricans]|uniref:Threonine synthase and cysteate synthase n=1 Tax=Halapricum desulfuricans TaxID=2841257 RepID=A0A897NR12_9EURY|nr:pyridoxal-phosphate dependent enzyme [Halapricum desulfuricans]QSG15218.1 Threonine synthase and cysteate synthase [Halapricum desulfuricans]
METTAAFTGLRCPACETIHDPETVTHRCPDCGGVLEAHYEQSGLDRAALTARRFGGVDRYAEFLPFPEGTLVTAGEGGTPLVEAPALAERLGVERVLIKDEGQNPTGSIADREAAVAVAAGAVHDAETVALPSTGDSGQAVSAYAARAGLDAEVFVPSRAIFDAKAMINVHGGEMSVVDGRFGDAVATFGDAIDEEPRYSLAPFETPYRQEGVKTAYYEIVEQLGWNGPDHVVYPTGTGLGPVGVARAAREFEALGWTDGMPAVHAVQAEGCAPIVEAFKSGDTEQASVSHPDTICGGIEIANPPAPGHVLDAVVDSGGTAIATSDAEILEAAVELAQSAAVEVGAAGGAAASAAMALAERDVFAAGETVVLVNPAAGNKEADVLRSHLMSKGV